MMLLQIERHIVKIRQLNLMNDILEFFCWCNSGIKLKDCHFAQEIIKPISFGERQKVRKKIWNKKYCLHPHSNNPSACSGKIIEAHTVQKSMLKKISVDSRVYAPIIKATPKKLEITFEKKGIGEVSIFTGFCSFHDNNIFRKIENEEFVGNAEQCFLYAYRDVCKELFLKFAHKEDTRYSQKLNVGVPFDILRKKQKFLDDYLVGIEAGISELSNLKLKFDKILLNKNFEDIHYCIFWINQIPEILCNGIFQLDFDFLGNPLQSWSNLHNDLDAITLSLIATKNGGAAVLAWHKSADETCLSQIQSLLTFSNSDIPNLIINWVVKELENIFISPVWWDSLPRVNQEIILDEFMDNPAFMIDRKPDYLINGRIRGIKWEITEITSNIFSIL